MFFRKKKKTLFLIPAMGSQLPKYGAMAYTTAAAEVAHADQLTV
jgi:hypothetical protein